MKKRTGLWTVSAPVFATAPVVALLFLPGCDSAGSAGDDLPDGGYTDTDCVESLDGADEPVFEQTNSRFTLTGDETYMDFSGAVWDGPAVEFHHEADREGACRLLTYEDTFCDPECAGGEVCIDS